jgi:hypothetical protein
MTENTSNQSMKNEESSFVVGNALRSIWNGIAGLRSHTREILFVGLFGALVGLGYSLVKKPVYQAKVNFVIEENKQNAGGLFSALAGQVGIDLSTLSGGAGVLAGDNVLELLKSPTLLRKVLLSSYTADTTHSLAWQYASDYGKLNDYTKLAGAALFPVSAGEINTSRVQDSLLTVLTTRIIEKELSVYKPDRKLSIFSLELSTRNELLSQLISMRLIKEAADFYIETKTRRLRINVDRLQKKADSISVLLNQRTMSTAAANILNANPAYYSTQATVEISGREKYLLNTIYSDLNKSLDITRTALIQETPTIEIIDRPTLPLKKVYTKPWLAMLAGFSIGIFLVSLLAFKIDR